MRPLMKRIIDIGLYLHCCINYSNVRCCNLCEALLCSRPRACPSVQPAAAISFVSRALTRGAPACFGATSLAWPVRPETPFSTDGNVIFRYHSGTPNSEVILYRKFCRATRGAPESVRKMNVGCGGRI